MVKALLVTSSFLPGKGGIESHLERLCGELAPALAVLAPGSRNGMPLPDGLGYPTSGFPKRHFIPGPPMVAAIERTARSHSTDRVLFGTFWPLALLGPSLARRGLRYGVLVHGAETLVPAGAPLLRRAVIDALAGADLVLAVSAYTGRAVKSLLEDSHRSAPPIDVLSPAVDLERFRPDIPSNRLRQTWGLDDHDSVVLSFGRLTRRKAVHKLIEAWPDIARRSPGARLVVAGRGPQLPWLQRRARRVGAPVVFPGRIASDDAPALYNAADVFVLPVADRAGGRAIEGLGIVLLEAAACCVPTVTGRSGGTAEAVADGVTGIVVDARRPARIASAVTELLQDPGLAGRMGRAGREHVSKHYSGSFPDALITWLG